MKENVILLVEDSAEDASLVLAAFKRWGITNPIHVTQDGEQAVEYLEGRGKYADRDPETLPTIAILDLTMPQMSGFEVLEWVRSRPKFSTMPVVVLSGTKDLEDFDKAHRLGANACVVKSLELNELHELIQHLNYFSVSSEYPSTDVTWSPDP
jgi:CheY-like chemotaxis protein